MEKIRTEWTYCTGCSLPIQFDESGTAVECDADFSATDIEHECEVRN